jgi:hypothetical protein
VSRVRCGSCNDPDALLGCPRCRFRVSPGPVTRLWFVVNGKPIAKGRPRVISRGERGVRGVRCAAFTPATTRAWEQRVRWGARAAASAARWEPNADPCEVVILLRGRNPLSDLDNHAKSVLDALNGVAWDDDRRVVRLVVEESDELAADGVDVTVRRSPKGFR